MSGTVWYHPEENMLGWFMASKPNTLAVFFMGDDWGGMGDFADLKASGWIMIGEL